MSMTPAALKAALAGDMKNFVAASTPGGIEAQERAGQIEQSFLETLPIDGTLKGWRGESPRTQWEKLGFEFGENADELFVNVKFPEGWRKRALDHAMWSELLDAKGRPRAAIFYKAAFYDRRAHVNLKPRYSVSAYHRNAGEKSPIRVVVLDGEVVLKEFGQWEEPNYGASEPIERTAHAWLKENFPDHNDVMAYWD